MSEEWSLNSFWLDSMPMRVLALDTTTRAGSVAMIEDGRVVEERAGDPALTHAERLPRELRALLAARGLTTADVDLFAVASGPGSFTGLRIGIATIQGLAFVHRRKVVPISALEALAWTAGEAGAGAGDLVGAWMDAHRRDVFSALYRVGAAAIFDADYLVEIDAPQVGDPMGTLIRWDSLVGDASLTLVGDGTPAWSEAVRRRHPAARVLGHPRLAGAIGRLAAARAATAGVDPSAVRPLYVRRPDAEVERDRRNAAQSALRGTPE